MASFIPLISSSCSSKIPSFMSSPMASSMINITIKSHRKTVCKKPQLILYSSSIKALLIKKYPIIKTKNPTTRSNFSKILVRLFFSIILKKITSEVNFFSYCLYIFLFILGGWHKDKYLKFLRIVLPT